MGFPRTGILSAHSSLVIITSMSKQVYLQYQLQCCIKMKS